MTDFICILLNNKNNCTNCINCVNHVSFKLVNLINQIQINLGLVYIINY